MERKPEEAEGRDHEHTHGFYCAELGLKPLLASGDAICSLDTQQANSEAGWLARQTQRQDVIHHFTREKYVRNETA